MEKETCGASRLGPACCLCQAGNLRERLLAVEAREAHVIKAELHAVLDQLISLDRICDHVSQTDVCANVVLLCRLVPPDQQHLLIKVAQLIGRLFGRLQMTADNESFLCTVPFLVKSIREGQSWMHFDLVQALATLLFNNGHRCEKLLVDLMEVLNGLFLEQSKQSADWDIKRQALLCMAHLCTSSQRGLCIPEPNGSPALVTSLTHYTNRPLTIDEVVYCLTIQAALRGVQALLCSLKSFPSTQLVDLMVILKRFMFYGLPGSLQHVVDSHRPAASPVSSSDIDHPGSAAACMGKKRSQHAKAEAPRMGVGLQRPGKPILRLHGSESCLQPAWRVQSSSESDVSDSETTSLHRLRLEQSRLRQASLTTLLTSIKAVERRELYSHWLSFVPEMPDSQSPSLCSIILKDSSSKARALALQVLAALLESSQGLLLMAEEGGGQPRAFTALSESMGRRLREIHRSLLLAMLAETSPHALVQTLKVCRNGFFSWIMDYFRLFHFLLCVTYEWFLSASHQDFLFCLFLYNILQCLATLASNAPYKRLHPGLPGSVWRKVWPFTHHQDVNVRVAALTLLGTLLVAQPPLPELQILLLQAPCPGWATNGCSSGESTPAEMERFDGLEGVSPSGPLHLQPITPGEGECKGIAGQDSSTSWLIKYCRNLILEKGTEMNGASRRCNKEPLPVRLEALQLLYHLTKGYLEVIHPSLAELVDIACACIECAEPALQLHGTKLLEGIGSALSKEFKSKEGPCAHNTAQQVLWFWNSVLDGPLIRALQSEQLPALQTGACEVLATVPPEIFEDFPDNKQIYCMTLLLGLSAADNLLVQSEAVRALGFYMLFPCLQKDSHFVVDAAEAILKSITQEAFVVRMNACWALGNLADALACSRECPEGGILSELPDSLIHKLIAASLNAVADKNKVKSNAVRAMGSLLYTLLPKHINNEAFSQLIEDSLRMLTTVITGNAAMKVRWNACYAYGSVFKNTAFLSGALGWRKEAMSALTSVIKCCKNFKVRIKASLALSSAPDRRWFGSADELSGSWRAVLTAMEQSREVVNFVEYRYSVTLQENLCQTLLHFLTLLRPEDLPTLLPELSPTTCFLKEHLSEVLKQPDGEGMLVLQESLQKAGQHINSLVFNQPLCIAKAVQQLAATLETVHIKHQTNLLSLNWMGNN
uniref:LOW QUALITY PROTEIN: HEAT repeat-containing protein 6 n=1 Tax=Myxine glutinosa TaxID=7769 RepID=UPI00358F4DB2